MNILFMRFLVYCSFFVWHLFFAYFLAYFPTLWISRKPTFDLYLGFPRPQTGGPNPHFLEKRVSGSKNPHFPSPLQHIEKGIFYVFPCRKKGGFFDRKLPFPERGEMGVFGPRNPLFQEMEIRAPVWGQGNPKPISDTHTHTLSGSRGFGVSLPEFRGWNPGR